MWSTPSSIARRSTARAALGSRGGPKTPGPASCIAPKPMRLIGLSPRNVVFISSLSPAMRFRSRGDLPEFDQFEAERFDLGKKAENRGPILQQTGEHGLAALQLGRHRGKGGQSSIAEPSLDPDRLQARRCGHVIILQPDLV